MYEEGYTPYDLLAQLSVHAAQQSELLNQITTLMVTHNAMLQNNHNQIVRLQRDIRTLEQQLATQNAVK